VSRGTATTCVSWRTWALATYAGPLEEHFANHSSTGKSLLWKRLDCRSVYSLALPYAHFQYISCRLVLSFPWSLYAMFGGGSLYCCLVVSSPCFSRPAPLGRKQQFSDDKEEAVNIKKTADR
jgi:hypothetical protein